MFDVELISGLLQALLMAFLVPLAGAASAALVAWVRLRVAELSETQQYWLQTAAGVGVFAAQQLYTAADGEAKKDYALDVAEKYLAQYGVKVDLNVLDAAIEAEVYKQFKQTS